MNQDFLIENGIKEGKQRMTKPVKDTKDILQKAIMSLEETGPTALGPAVASAVAMATEGSPGSTVVVCTDGLANVGLGSFDEIKSEEDMKMADEFYERIGELAKSRGVTVNIISIEGEECNIDSLSKISEITGGHVERVSPAQLTQNFANILSKPVIGTNVTTKVKLHKGLEFRNEPLDALSEDRSLMARDMGNVHEDTLITFEYRLKNVSALVKMEDIDLTKLKTFPFQTQITYTSLEGDKCVRIITKFQDISSDKQELKRKASFGIIKTHAIQQSSKMAKVGNLRGAQANAKAWNRVMRGADNKEQAEHYAKFNDHFEEVYDAI